MPRPKHPRVGRNEGAGSGVLEIDGGRKTEPGLQIRPFFIMRKTGFSAAARRRGIRLTVVLSGFAVLVLLVIFALRRGADLMQRRSSEVSTAVSVEDLWAEGDYADVARLAEERLRLDPMDRNALLFAGYSRYFLAISRLAAEERNSDLDLAVGHLRLLRARGGTPHPERVDYMLGKAYLTKGIYWSDLAVDYLESALRAGYEPEDIYEFLGRAYSALDDVNSALQWYEKAAEYHPTDRLLITLGGEAFKLRLYDEAAEYYRRAVDVSRDDSVKEQGLSQLGRLYYDVGNYEAAREVLERLIGMESGNENSLFLLAETYYELGMSGKARSYWFAVTRIDPRHVGALRRLYD